MRLLRISCLTILLLVGGFLPLSAAELNIFAASSLTDALQDVARDYQLVHPEVQLLLQFAGSQTLATQIEQGAPADLFISANHAVMERLRRQGLAEAGQTLLRNQLLLVIRQDLEPTVTQLAELSRPGLLLAIGNPQVPIGQYTRQLFRNLAGDPVFGPGLVQQIEANVVSEESRVKAIIAKLLLGEADAGIVYQSDMAGPNARNLRAVSLPAKHNPQASYSLTLLSGGHAACADFAEYLGSNQAQQVFARYGFDPGIER